ncbi:hypothetical protein LCGC14_1701240 [marine sediment metagenome]|uniref:Uncharacterized protein n=1 Tax=marine sediment metagenome TaxID=412755 RepID=A0A0F9KHW2_9ZZZZ
MKSLLIAFLVSFLFAAPVAAEEQVDLATVDQAQAGTLTYRVAQLTLDWEHGRIVIRLVGDNGERKEVVFGDADNARSMMRALNKADLSAKSLHRRIIEKLISDGHLVGSISGAPD